MASEPHNPAYEARDLLIRAGMPPESLDQERIEEFARYCEENETDAIDRFKFAASLAGIEIND